MDKRSRLAGTAQRVLLALLALFVVAPASAAQRVRGVVRDSASSAPLPGAVVAVVDSAGNTGARTIADGAGAFSLTLGIRAARLRVIRIGYAPRDVSLPAVRAAGDVIVSFAMFRLPPVLDAVRVIGTELCPGSADRGGAFQLWEQARAGLLASVVAREAKPAAATTLMFENRMYVNDNLIQRQSVTPRSGRTTKPFIAAEAPAAFAKKGYLAEDASGDRTYSAPDEDVLLDESFAATHCFHLQSADAAHRDQIGLAFTPVRGRDTIVDVTGVIWIDRAAPALHTLEFLYTNLEPAATRVKVGGNLLFHTMPNGVAFIEYWTLRLPVMTQGLVPATSAMRSTPPRTGRRQDAFDLRVAEIFEAGGQVLHAIWDDSVRWDAPPTGLAGTILQRGTKTPIPYALVTLRGTADTATADAEGRFTLTPVVAGRYTVIAIDTTLGAFTADRRATDVVNIPRGVTAQFRTELAPLTSVLADVCKGQHIPPKTGTIVGHVAPTDGLPLGGADVRGVWQSDFSAPRDNTISISTSEQHSTVDDRGRFVMCGVARGRPVHLRVSRGAAFADMTVTMAEDTTLASVDWRPRMHNFASEGMATLTGIVVRDSSRTPVAGAEVSVGTTGRSAVTGADGVFRIADIPSGQHTIQIRHVGDQLLSDSVMVDANDAARRHTFFLKRAVVLDTVRTVVAGERYISPNLRSFEERKKAGGGSFIGDSVLRQNEISLLGNILRARAAGLRVLGSGSTMFATSQRDQRNGAHALDQGMRGCFSTIYLDGVMQYDMQIMPLPAKPPNLNDYPVNQLGAIEFYPAGATAPTQYRSGECGLLLLWTRER